MDFVKGAAVCDREALQRMGVKPSDVAKLVSETFNEMIFTFGDVSTIGLSWLRNTQLANQMHIKAKQVFIRRAPPQGGDVQSHRWSDMLANPCMQFCL